MEKLFVDKIHFFKFLFMNDKPRLHQLKIITSSRRTVPASLSAWMFSIQTKKYQQGKGKTQSWEQIQGLTNLFKHTEISYSIVLLVFRKFSYRTYRNGLNQKVPTMLVWYLLSGMRILVHSRTGCGTSKIYLCLECNRSLFSRVNLKSEAKDAHR